MFRLNSAAAIVSDALDRYLWDGAVRFLAQLGEFSGAVNRETDEDLINQGFDASAESLRKTGKGYSFIQTGEVHGYLRVVAIGFVLLVLIVMLGGAR